MICTSIPFYNNSTAHMQVFINWLLSPCQERSLPFWFSSGVWRTYHKCTREQGAVESHMEAFVDVTMVTRLHLLLQSLSNSAQTERCSSPALTEMGGKIFTLQHPNFNTQLIRPGSDKHLWETSDLGMVADCTLSHWRQKSNVSGVFVQHDRSISWQLPLSTVHRHIVWIPLAVRVPSPYTHTHTHTAHKNYTICHQYLYYRHRYTFCSQKPPNDSVPGKVLIGFPWPCADKNDPIPHSSR